jgi:hypothetical protein
VWPGVSPNRQYSCPTLPQWPAFEGNNCLEHPRLSPLVEEADGAIGEDRVAAAPVNATKLALFTEVWDASIEPAPWAAHLLSTPLCARLHNHQKVR